MSTGLMYNGTEPWPKRICIRTAWHYTGKQCWTTHFHFTEGENRSWATLAGENKSVTPRKPSYLNWPANVTLSTCTYPRKLFMVTKFPSKELFADGTTSLIIFTSRSWTHMPQGAREALICGRREKIELSKPVLCSVPSTKHPRCIAYVMTSIKHGLNRRSYR